MAIKLGLFNLISRDLRNDQFWSLINLGQEDTVSEGSQMIQLLDTGLGRIKRNHNLSLVADFSTFVVWFSPN